MDRLEAAVKGAIIGGTLAAPRRGQSKFRTLNYYEPIPARMAPNTALDAWIVAAEHRSADGRPEGYGCKLAGYFHYLSDETAFGHFNRDLGLSAPLTGSFENPLSAGSQAIGRAAGWGLLFPDDPASSCRYAFFDASFDHDKEGVWAAMAVARMASVASSACSLSQILKAATGVLPPSSLSLKAATAVLGSYNQGVAVEELVQRLPVHLGIRDGLHAALNFGYVMIGLIYGKGDLAKSILLTAGCGGAADQTTVAVGTIVGAWSGDVPDDYLRPLGDLYVAGHGLKRLSSPMTFAEFEERLRFARLEPKAIDLPATPEDDDDTAEEGEEAVEAPQVQPEVTGSPAMDRGEEVEPLVANPPKGTVAMVDHLLFQAEYVDSPVAFPGKSVKIILTVTNPDQPEKVLELSAAAPKGWQLASKLGSFRLRAGESSSFPIVVQPPPEEGVRKPEAVAIDYGPYRLKLPILPPQLWYQVGPFVNHEGTGFDKVYRCEDVLSTREVFSGRSELPVSWKQAAFPGTTFDLEPDFKRGPGVIYLYAKVRFAEAGRYRIVCATSTGCIVWVNRQQLLKYHDVHVPIPRAIQPYVASFDASDTVEILVKVLRNLQPLEPTVIYFLTEDGRVVRPSEFLPMD